MRIRGRLTKNGRPRGVAVDLYSVNMPCQGLIEIGGVPGPLHILVHPRIPRTFSDRRIFIVAAARFAFSFGRLIKRVLKRLGRRQRRRRQPAVDGLHTANRAIICSAACFAQTAADGVGRTQRQL